MVCFLQSDIRKQKKYEKRKQTSVDNTVNDLHYEIKFENIQIVKVLKNLILGIFCRGWCWKHICASAKTSNAALVNLLIESLKMIMWLIVCCFSVYFFLYKNTFCKNTEAQITQKIRTIQEQRPGWMQVPKKNSRVRNRSNQLKLDTNEQWINRMHKLRRNFTIK